ncbi:hypothetical protein ScPMuIL_001348 [Solemya velum]
MPVNSCPDLDKVYAKWENRGRGQSSNNSDDRLSFDTSSATRNEVNAQGRQRWKEKYGSNVRPLSQRRTRQRERPKPVTIYENKLNVDSLANFKTTPTILPDSSVITRPKMGQCCSCLPMSKKDLVPAATTSYDLKNILDLSKDIRKDNALLRPFGCILFSLRRGPYEKYPDVSMAALTSKRLVEAVQQQAEELSIETELNRMNFSLISRLQKKTEKLLTKMKANISARLIRFTGWFLFKFLGRVLNSVQVHQGQIEMIQSAVERGLPVIYLPSHKSHLDYILVTWILWISDIKAPYVAAGENLSMFFFSFLLSGLGGFFIRRKIDNGSGRRDLVYRTLLHSYLEEVLRQGEALEFFIEGGRTRSGKVCMPKGGLMSVVVDSFVSGVIDDAYIVPISINYERLVDGNFNNEQMGLPKTRETFFGALRAIWKVLNRQFGNVRVEIAQPFSLKEYINNSQQIKCRSIPPSLESPPSEVLNRSMSSCSSLCGGDMVVEEHKEIIRSLSKHVLYDSVHMTPLMCSNILAFLFLTKYREGVTLLKLTEEFFRLQEEIRVRKRDVGYCGKTEEIVQYALNILGSELISSREADDNNNEKLYCANLELPGLFELSYYANSVIPVFLLESIVVNSVIYETGFVLSTVESNPPKSEAKQVSRERILSVASQLCELLSCEFVFCPPCRKLEEDLAETLDHLVTSEIFLLEEKQLGSQYSVYDKQWANRLSSSLSWADENNDGDCDDDEEGIMYSDQLIKINVARKDCMDQLEFLHMVVASILESYLITAYHIAETLQTETPEADFIKTLHDRAKERVVKQVATYGESAAQDTLRNAVRSYQKLGIVDNYRAGNLNILAINEHFEVKDRLFQYIELLETLRD